MIKKVSILLCMTMVLLSGCGVDMKDSTWEDNAKGEPITLGDLKNYHSEEPLKNEEVLDVMMSIDGATIDVSKSDDRLYEADVKTNSNGLKPRIDLREDRLNITYNKPGINFNIKSFGKLDDFVNDWNLELTGDVPLDLDIENNACKADYDFTGMTIEGLTMDLNACDATLDFDETNKGTLDKVDMDFNAGNVKITGLAYTKVQDMDIDMNAGNLLIYFDDKLQGDVTMDIEVNVGNITIDMPEDSGIRLKKKSALLSVDIDRLDFERITKDEYRSKNYDDAKYRLDLNIRGNAANVTLK